MEIKGEKLNDKLVMEIGKFSILWNCFERFQCDNLIHGLKCIEQLHDQLELFQAVNGVLESVDWIE